MLLRGGPDLSLLDLYSKFPSLNCGACFAPTCRSFARRCLLGLNSPRDCPVLGWAEAGLKAVEAEQAIKSHLVSDAPPEAKVVGTPLSVYHPCPDDSRIGFLDAETLKDLVEVSSLFDSIRWFPSLDAVRVTKGTRSLLIVSDGRVLPTGPGPPSGLVLSPMVSLIWGAVNL